MSMRKVVTSAMVGNGLEWFDYALYGHFAPLISRHFFPSNDPTVSLIATFGIFAVGFLMRPLGAIIFGIIGDIYGRRQALTISILLMAIPTACIGLLPTYETIGILAPILLTFIRLLQGTAIGGEFGGCVVYLVEHASDKHRNLIGSTSLVSALLGVLLGAGISSLLANVMEPEFFETYGWRIPFILGLFIGLIGLYIRMHLSESPAFLDAKETGHLSDKPVLEVFRVNMRELLLAIGIYFAVTIPFYIQVVFMNSFMVKFLSFSVSEALTINTIAIIIMILATIVSGYICDRYQRINLLKAVLLAYFAFAVPFIALLNLSTFYYALLAQILFSIIVGFYIAPIPTMLVDVFPTRVRYTGMSIACNVCAALFGGTTPAVLTYLLKTTDGNNYVISIYIILAAIISLLAIMNIRTKNHYNI